MLLLLLGGDCVGFGTEESLYLYLWPGHAKQLESQPQTHTQ